MQNNIYVIGHKIPDLDSVAAAICYARYKNLSENTDRYLPAVTGKINKETKFTLEKFKYDVPEALDNAEGLELILVDHNEFGQALDRVADATKIHEVLDHHKVSFDYGEPIKFNIEALGASCTIVANLFFDKNLKIEEEMAGLLLSAILIDTVISKSPTCTEVDIEAMNKLSKIANIKDWKSYGMELFEIRSDMGTMSDVEILKSDYKDFEVGGKKIGIGQVETANLSSFESRANGLVLEIEKLKSGEGYFAVILFITDIINEGSLFLVKTEDVAGFEKAFGKPLVDDKAYIENIISRKKQVAPQIIELYSK